VTGRRGEEAFEVLEHPADVGFRAFGQTLAELFENSALALLSIRAELDGVNAREEYAVEADATDLEALLVNWLNEILYLLDARAIALRRVRVDAIEDTHVRSAGMGEPFDSSWHRLRVIVKAVTWHQLKIVHTNEGWVAEVFLDV
jgi:SHS2 domain-containing protein